MAQLVCRNLCLGYGGQRVIENVNFEVESGGYLAIIGENGAGKSTLIKTLMGLTDALEGEIVTEGVGAREIGYMPQQTAVQRDFPASVREVVLSGFAGSMGKRPFYNKRERQLAEESMKRLEITDLADKCYRELSGGQQQRTLLARAVCGAKKLLVLDEPAASLDAKAAAILYDIIEELNKKDGITVIMVSHDIGAALKYADSILHLSTEEIFFGSRDEYLKSPLYSDLARQDMDSCAACVGRIFGTGQNGKLRAEELLRRVDGGKGGEI